MEISLKMSKEEFLDYCAYKEGNDALQSLKIDMKTLLNNMKIELQSGTKKEIVETLSEIIENAEEMLDRRY